MNTAVILPIDLRKHRWRFVESKFLRATISRKDNTYLAIFSGGCLIIIDILFLYSAPKALLTVI